MWLHEKEEKAKKEVADIQKAKENLIGEKVQEIEALNKSQEELRFKTVEDIIELKKETNHLIVEKAHLFDS